MRRKSGKTLEQEEDEEKYDEKKEWKVWDKYNKNKKKTEEKESNRNRDEMDEEEEWDWEEKRGVKFKTERLYQSLSKNQTYLYFSLLSCIISLPYFLSSISEGKFICVVKIFIHCLFEI